MNATVNCNPIEAFRLLDQMDLTNRAYLARTIVSALNAMMIGQLAQVARREQVGEGSGIDGANDLIAAALEREIDDEQSEDAGLEVNDPFATAESLASCASDVIENLGLSANLAEAINRPHDTLQFIRARQPEKVDKAQAEKLAAALEVNVDDATKAIARLNQKRYNDFQAVAHQIPELLATMTYGAGSFEQLPNRTKMRVAQKIEQHLATKLTNEIQRVITTSGDNMGDIAMLKAAITAVKKWISDHADTDELARQLRAAA